MKTTPKFQLLFSPDLDGDLIQMSFTDSNNITEIVETIVDGPNVDLLLFKIANSAPKRPNWFDLGMEAPHGPDRVFYAHSRELMRMPEKWIDKKDEITKFLKYHWSDDGPVKYADEIPVGKTEPEEVPFEDWEKEIIEEVESQFKEYNEKWEIYNRATQDFSIHLELAWKNYYVFQYLKTRKSMFGI